MLLEITRNYWYASATYLNAMQPRFDRGYTGHEHMCGFGLINMNGRLYDPYLQRFLSPDPHIISPTNAQDYNRYSYVLNNPLVYTDPSGYSRIGTPEELEAARIAYQNWWNNWTGQLESPGGGLGFSILPFGYLGSLQEARNFIRFGQSISYNNGQWGYYNYVSQPATFISYQYSQEELDFLSSLTYEEYKFEHIHEEAVKKPDIKVWVPLELTNFFNNFFSFSTRAITGFGVLNKLRERLEWEFLRQARINRAISGNYSLPINHSLPRILRVGQRISFVSGIISLGKFTMEENKSWGSYGELGVGLISAGLTYAPEPITTGIGIVIGVIDLFGGFDGFYQSLDLNQQFYNTTGFILMPSNHSGLLIIKIK